MKPKTQGKHTKIFYYILPPLILLFIFLMIYRNSNPPQEISPNQTPEILSNEEPGMNTNNQPILPEPDPDKNLIRPETEPSQTPVYSSEDSSASQTPAKENPESPFTVTNSRAITPKDNFIAPRFSPDGLDVICSKPNYTGLYLVSLDGSEIRQLSNESGIGYNVRWSPDGTKLIIKNKDKTKVIDLSGEEQELTEAELKLLEEEKVYARENNIYLKDPQSGEEVSITSGEDSFFNPLMSPDGNKVAYQGLSTGIHIKDIGTGEVIDLGQGSNFNWLPDGSGLIYNFTQDDGLNIIAGDIYFAYTDGSGIFNITNTPDVIEMNPYISPDGRYLTYEVDGQVFIADLIRGH
jgi:Tol biopolymer transport system component